MIDPSVAEKLRNRSGREFFDDETYSAIICARLYGARPDPVWLREKVRDYLKPKRVPHVLGTEQEARALAALWGEDVENAAEAAILHDITKRCTREEQLRLCEKYAIMNDTAELETDSLFHAKTGAALAADVFGCEKEVCDAIRWHTTGKPGMTRLEKIIFLADYVEPHRSFPGVEEVRALCRENLDSAMALALAQNNEIIRARGYEPYKDSLEALEYYLKITKGA